MESENYPQENIVAKPLFQLGIQCEAANKMLIFALQSVSSQKYSSISLFLLLIFQFVKKSIKFQSGFGANTLAEIKIKIDTFLLCFSRKIRPNLVSVDHYSYYDIMLFRAQAQPL
jgi:hypothetical protein